MKQVLLTEKEFETSTSPISAQGGKVHLGKFQDDKNLYSTSLGI